MARAWRFWYSYLGDVLSGDFLSGEVDFFSGDFGLLVVLSLETMLTVTLEIWETSSFGEYLGGDLEWERTLFSVVCFCSVTSVFLRDVLIVWEVKVISPFSIIFLTMRICCLINRRSSYPRAFSSWKKIIKMRAGKHWQPLGDKNMGLCNQRP